MAMSALSMKLVCYRGQNLLGPNHFTKTGACDIATEKRLQTLYRISSIDWKTVEMPSEKDCFGVLDRVFPMGGEGLREVDPECLECTERIECLRAALDTREGLAFRGEVIDRSAQKGFVGRLKRWSDKKALHRRMQKRKEEEKK